ncbi:unnamed protein product [Brassica rapa subsp. narinosa]
MVNAQIHLSEMKPGHILISFYLRELKSFTLSKFLKSKNLSVRES